MDINSAGADDNKSNNDVSRPQSTRPDSQQDRVTSEAYTEAQDAEAREIRQLIQEHAHLDLEHLAPLTRSRESGIYADRFRYLFGCQWLSKACGQLSIGASLLID